MVNSNPPQGEASFRFAAARISARSQAGCFTLNMKGAFLMSKFLSFWLSVILAIFFIFPTSAYAGSYSPSYTYYVMIENKPFDIVASGSNVPIYHEAIWSTVIYNAIKDEDPSGYSFYLQDVYAFISELSYYDDSGNLIFYDNPRNIPIPFDMSLQFPGAVPSQPLGKPDQPNRLSIPHLLTFPDPMNNLQNNLLWATSLYNFDAMSNLPFLGHRCLGKSAFYFIITTSKPLDISEFTGDISSGLLTISSDLHTIQSTIQNFYQLFVNQSLSLNKHLLDIINAINNISGSGGGNAAIVGAINAATGQINKVLAQQQVSSDSIVGAIGSQTTSINSSLGLVQSAVSGVTEELKRQAQANLDSVQSDGNKVTGMASDLLDQVNDKWSALTVPIDFTKKIYEVFTNGTRSASYRRIYGHIAGYRYDSTTGGLEPIYTAQERAIGGTVITLPAFDFNLPGVGTLHVWDSYDFDLGQLKTDFPIVFDAIYVISGILMIYWIVEFIIHLGNELLDI